MYPKHDIALLTLFSYLVCNVPDGIYKCMTSHVYWVPSKHVYKKTPFNFLHIYVYDSRTKKLHICHDIRFKYSVNSFILHIVNIADLSVKYTPLCKGKYVLFDKRECQTLERHILNFILRNSFENENGP